MENPPDFVKASDLIPTDEKLIDELFKLQLEKKKIEEAVKIIKEQLIIIAKQKHTDTLYGSKMRASIREFMKVVYPEETKFLLIQTLKNKGLYEEYMHLNHFKLTPKIMKKEIDPEIIKLVKRELDYRVSLFPL